MVESGVCRFTFDASKQRGCAGPTTVLSETRGLSLFLVVRGGIGFHERLTGLTGLRILTLEPERLQNRPSSASDAGWRNSLTGAQAACGFSCSASKRTPFFQISKVIAAIL